MTDKIFTCVLLNDCLHIKLCRGIIERAGCRGGHPASL